MISSRVCRGARKVNELAAAAWSEQDDLGEVVIHATKLLWMRLESVLCIEL